MLALVLTVPATDAELATDALWGLGVLAVEERDAPPLVELWTSLGEATDELARQLAALPERWRWRFVEVDDSVVDTWRQHAVPTWVAADLLVHPAWVAVDAAPPAISIAIEPGATFGLGDHPTTVLSLRAMRAALFPGAVVLDVGCGSGVLSVAATLLGAVRAVAVDISPAAVEVTLANAERNGVAGRVEVSTTPLAEVAGSYDVVVANILAPALIELAADLRRLLAAGGLLVISGILAGRHDHVVDALAPLRVVDEQTLDGWSALTLRW